MTETFETESAPWVAPRTIIGAVDRSLWRFALLLAVFTSLGIWLLGWTVQREGLAVILGSIGLLAAIGAFYAWSGRSDSIARVGLAMALLLVLTFTCQAATYVIATKGAPFRDAQLRAADAALGFSWTAWAAWVRQHPAIDLLFRITYPCHLPETAVAVLVLALRSKDGATRLLRAFVLAFVVAAVGLLALPALGNVPQAPAVAVRLALRVGTFRTFDLVRTTGLISMPSFHAVLAVLIPFALWPVRAIRWPIVTLNLIMLAATVTVGGHYLVDVLAGIALAFGVAWAVGMPAANRG